jgi:ATP-dependent DNA helicase RecG
MIKNIVSKEKISRAHFLQFSATPIPRTFAMINSSLVDYSFIKELPFEKNITTKIIRRADFKTLIRHIESELAKDHQIAVIYPLVEESENIAYQSIDEAKEYWEKRYENVFVTYGKDKAKDEILKKFQKKGSILISTTVIEVGICYTVSVHPEIGGGVRFDIRGVVYCHYVHVYLHRVCLYGPHAVLWRGADRVIARCH